MRDDAKVKLEGEIMGLATRGYIRKSELIHLSLTCDDPSVTLEDVEGLMSSLADESVTYIDDVDTNSERDWFLNALETKKELESAGFPSVYAYLGVQKDLPNPVILAVLREMALSEAHTPLLEGLSRLLFNEQRLYQYRLLEETGFLWQELLSRKREGRTLLEPHEHDRMLNELTERLDISVAEATRLLEQGLEACGIQRSTREPSLTESPERQVAEKHTPERQIRNSVKKGRGRR